MMLGSGEGSSATTKGGDVGEDTTGMLKKGPWTAAEDAILMDYVRKNGEGNWNAVQRNSGLSRCGKSCRLRWANHLRPNLKKGSFSPEEERLILELHSKLGNKWARMAAQLPGRTDNEIKNYWNTRIKRRQRAGLPLYPPDIQRQPVLHQNHQSPAPLLTDNKPQFTGNPSPFPLFDPVPMSYSSAQSIAAPAPTSMMCYSLFGASTDSRSMFPPSGSHHQQQLKRTREDNLGLSNSLFLTNPVAPMLRFNSRNNVPSLQQQQQQTYPVFSMKMELPSSQYLSLPPGSDGEDPWGRNNSGLLDALLEESQGNTNRKMSVCDLPMEMLLPKSKIQEEFNRKDMVEDMKDIIEKCGSCGDSLLAETKMKNEALDNVESVNDDLYAVFDFLPPVQMPVEATPIAGTRLKNDSGETSNGQSSGITEDDHLGLDMQQLASSLPMAVEDHNWTIGSDHWDNMPGIC